MVVAEREGERSMLGTRSRWEDAMATCFDATTARLPMILSAYSALLPESCAQVRGGEVGGGVKTLTP